MDLDDFAAVRAVVDAGTFSAAAVQLGVAQPALSRRIARIERRLGGRLFDRLPRHAAPTALGASVAEAAQRLFIERDRALERAEAVARGEAGTVRVACLAGGISLLARGFARFQTARPDVWVEVRALGAAPSAALLRSGEVDLATLPGSMATGDLSVRRLGRWRTVVAVRRSHRLARARHASIRDLAGEPVLLLSTDFMVTEHVRALAARAGVELHARLLDGSPEAALALARHGWGAAIVPDAVRLPAGLVAVPLSEGDAAPDSDYLVAWLRERTLPDAAAALVETLVAETAAFRT